MYCVRCGTKNPDRSEHCFNCGERMDSPRYARPAGTPTGAAAKPAPAVKPPVLVDIAGTILTVTDQEISFGKQILRCDDVVAIRYGVYKHYINGIRDRQSYAVWLTDGPTTISIECAKGFLTRSSTIESRYEQTLKALYPAVMVPLIQSFLMNLDKGDGFRIADVTFDKNGIHRSGSLGSIHKGVLSAWVSLVGGRPVEEREQRYQHLAWSEFGGHSLGGGHIHLFRNKETWIQFPLRDTWNAVCLGPLFDFLYENGRLWSFVNR